MRASDAVEGGTQLVFFMSSVVLPFKTFMMSEYKPAALHASVDWFGLYFFILFLDAVTDDTLVSSFPVNSFH